MQAASLQTLTLDRFREEHDEDDLASGTIYVLRSKSDNPMLQRNREVLHKIGVTGGRVEHASQTPAWTQHSSWPT